MLLVPRPAGKPRSALARIFLAVTLVLVLLAGVAPLGSLSASHECAMACCAGKPPHMAGSCSIAFITEAEQENDATGDESTAGHAAHDGVAHHAHASDAKNPSSHHSTHRKSSPGRASVAPQALTTTHCSPECAAAASASTQLRRPRDAAALSGTVKPPAPALLSHRGRLAVLPPRSAEVVR
ncbi:MAG TPA: hypothetical protein VJT09_12060, partial [Pyrinomonadaceae bacterium]|nr:hypothetical protein [Pyrinomonadaceae bacterium]